MNSDAAFHQLETKVDHLIATCQTLRLENQLLREQLALMQQQQHALSSKNAHTTHQVKQIIHQLREHLS